MKKITSLLSAALVIVLCATNVKAAHADENPTVKAKALNFNKIWVSGKVKLILVQGDKEHVRGISNYNRDMTSVSQQGQMLIINTMEREQVTLRITLKELQRIEAYGEAIVTTEKHFDVTHLQLFLNQSATAKIKANTGSIYTVVNDDAVLKVSGETKKSTLYACKRKNINFNNLASLQSEHYITDPLSVSQQMALKAK